MRAQSMAMARGRVSSLSSRSPLAQCERPYAGWRRLIPARLKEEIVLTIFSDLQLPDYSSLVIQSIHTYTVIMIILSEYDIIIYIRYIVRYDMLI